MTPSETIKKKDPMAIARMALFGSRLRKAMALVGKKIGRWTLISLNGKSNGKYIFLAKCDCGSERLGSFSQFGIKKSQSCGCLRDELVSIKSRTHGHGCFISGKPSPTYLTWRAMKARCSDPNINGYHNYGGRGIRVCKSWQKSFIDFLNDMGPRPSKKHSLDRIDNNKGYYPKNCRWATSIEQARNKRKNTNRHKVEGKAK